MIKKSHVATFVLVLCGYAYNGFAVCTPDTLPEHCACALDLNGDGMLADAAEVPECSNIADGGLCPLDKPNCSRPSPAPVEATGFYCPLTNTASGCFKAQFNSVIDPDNGNYAAGQPTNFYNAYNVGSYFQSAIDASINGWTDAITCTGPALLPDTRTRVEVCTNPPAPAPIPATGYWCPLTNTQTGCYRGLNGYVVDPYTGQYQTGPRTPNYSTYTTAITEQPGYSAYIASTPMNHLSAISCQQGSTVALCESVTAGYHCPIPSGGACTTTDNAALFNFCPVGSNGSGATAIFYNLACVSNLASFSSQHIATTRFVDAYNTVDHTAQSNCTATSAYGDWSTTDIRTDVDLCDNLAASAPAPAQLTISTQPIAPAIAPTTYTCPYAGQSCIADEADGVMRCSNTQCYDKSVSTAATPLSTTLYVNDAPYNETGECLGSLYIFNGRAMRCHPSAPKTMFRNCCSGDLVGDTMPESLGSQAEMGLKLEAVAIAAVVAYDAAATLATAAYEGWGASAATGAGMAAGTESAASILTNGWNVAFLTVAVLNYMYEGACDQLDFETVLLNKSGMCYTYGTRCVDENSLGCMKRESTFCCFNSRLARIIHQQGRPQLPQIDWGNINQPNCRGYTPMEFQSLNFSQMDMSEYYGLIRDKVETQVPQMQQTIETNIQDSIQNVR